ncbi:peamaclein-like [Bidens hawaiensis]|uniref:peamaclein-like n=1 Tax=Bidens hawaiensis TaxID=980011 RepID=UPI00404A64D9
MNHLSLVALLIAGVLFLSLAGSSAAQSPALSPAPASTDALGCDGKCAYRCSRSGWKDRCLKYCGICCGKCKGCVPAGPYADKAQCPCYRDMKNPKGRDKCP